MSEAGTRFLLRQPQLLVSAPLVLDPYAEIRQDPSDQRSHRHPPTHTQIRQAGPLWQTGPLRTNQLTT